MFKTAVLSDIHGNTFALRAVLADAANRGVTLFANLGDVFHGPLDPAGTWAILSTMDIPTVRGNQDRMLLEEGGEDETLAFVKRALPQKAHDWVYFLPSVLQVRGMCMLHGGPGDDTAYLTEEIVDGQPRLKECADILRGMPIPAPPLVLCGHSHIPRVVRCENSLVVNPGSVGLPAYRDDEPPHAMQAGDPRARYAIVEETADGWEAELVAVDYDFASAAALARKNGREDWALWLETGKA
ncbi:metallophosphoesterase family protein [Salidesulfovibrio brasiliensis]|uniref:metallophosphoesterase family protein n=1 Tax=Salidesulfovibrio brasiliensis TaxID=221711 RepID=UPI0006D27CF7|nr:metallophosphoesterase family protein [Salidesulfovibrio brasiliensis]